MVARYSSSASYLGAFGSGYNCDPSSVTFDHQGNMYVGQADCAGSILKFDPSGNLWITNNWKNVPIPDANPGGYEMVVFVGAARPTRTPLIGPPRPL